MFGDPRRKQDDATPVRRRGARALAYVVFVGVLAATAALAIERNTSVQNARDAQRKAESTEFVNEIDTTVQNLSSELDRLNELMAGAAAFDAAFGNVGQNSLSAFLGLTSATERFPGLVDAIVIRDQRALVEEAADVEPGFATRLETEAQTAFDEVGANFAADLAQAPFINKLERLVDEQTSLAPFLSVHEVDGISVSAITFPLESQSAGPGWAAIIFDNDLFLRHTLAPAHRLRSTLTHTGLPVGATELVYLGPDSVEVTTNAEDRFEAHIGVDAFGSEVILEASKRIPSLGVDRGQVWVLAIAGTALGIALFLALRTLERSRATAVASALSAGRDRDALGRRLRASFERAPIGMAEIDATGCLVEVNPALCKQTGRTRHDILGRPLSMLVHEADRQTHINKVESLITEKVDAVQGEHRFQQPGGGLVWVHESISPIATDVDGPRTWLVQCQDITAQRRAAWELAQQALHDDLTGLPNRALFLNRLKTALARASRNQTQVAVMFIDIDRFKVINDSLGHEMGDEFLIQIAKRIGTALRTGDTVARFGGDEFVVLCEAVHSDSEATAAAQRIQGAFSEPFLLGNNPTYATASIGITLSSPGESSADALLRDADAAMYRAKDMGRNRSEIFDHSMRSAILARMEIESQLRNALENGEIVMHFQAIVDPHLHTPVGYEALIRWNHPEKGLLGPAAFLPVAEEAGLIHLIDSFALRATCEHIVKWVQVYPAAKNLYVATNWSARHLGRFLQQVEQVLEETGIDPSQLVIEVTEGFLLEDSDASLKALEKLKELGVLIAIDDFGTGYSSLSYLTQFAVDYLKIDRSFVTKLPEDKASAAVIGAIADMATRLGITLIAEGVETDAQIAMLGTLGSPRMQGYRFAKPRPAADIEHQLALRSGAASADPHDPDAIPSTLAAAGSTN